MRWILITGLLLSAVAAAALYPARVYISAAESFSSVKQDEPVLVHFWADKKHADSFRVSQHYLLQHERGDFSGRLFSIIYATTRPDEVRLGIYLDVAQQQSIIEQQVFTISELNHTEQ